ncbi:MAG TPA: NAD(P)/FAD-dependent oxidoreductase, partial [bacterium]|nr:NAD(P)/FAD-dependent oxidoreductase [bacterium]
MKQAADAIVIGGGASGMMAAIVAARNGTSVRILERMQRVGKKLLATGNGRCNLSNQRVSIEDYHGTSPKFAAQVLHQFDCVQTMKFFEELGIAWRIEDHGRVFPLSDQASSVLDVLRFELDRLGVPVECETIIQKVVRDDDGLSCLSSEGLAFKAHKVIVATGGKSAPNLGSNGGGFRIAQALGHHIVEPHPALVPVTLDCPALKHINGVKVIADAQALVDGVPQGREVGEVLFTEYGVSGSPILALSRIISESLLKGSESSIQLDLFPEMSFDELLSFLRNRFSVASEKSVSFSFVGLVHKRLISLILKEAEIQNAECSCSKIGESDISRIAKALKGLKFRCSGTLSWMYSQVTAGGVDVREVDRRTLESKVVPGVYFAGEVLDVDGNSGG